MENILFGSVLLRTLSNSVCWISFIFSIGIRLPLDLQLVMEFVWKGCLDAACVYCVVTSLVKTSKGGVHSLRSYSWGFSCLSVSAWTKPLLSSAHSVLPDAQNGTNWSMHIHTCRGSAAWTQHQTTSKLQTFCCTLQCRAHCIFKIVYVNLLMQDTKHS